MNVINRSPYDTRHLRRTVLAVARCRWASRPRWWKTLKVYILLTGAKVPKTYSEIWNPQAGQIYIRVPKLTGDEWHQIARNEPNGRALTTARFASLVYTEFAEGTTSSWVVDQKWLRKLPAVVPLRAVKPPAPARDPVRDRLERAMAQEKNWIRKQKLAGTKVKFYRKRKLYYEKRLAARTEAV